MNTRKEIQDELLNISPAVAGIPAVNVFLVPDGYFNSLSFNILAALPLDTTILNDIPKHTLSVPEGYFDGLAASILNKIKDGENESFSTEIAALSPAVAAIGNKNIFTVPAGYFEQNAVNILNVLPQPARVVSMKKRPLFSRYAVAAAFTGLIGLSIISFFSNRPDKNNSLFASQETKTAMTDANLIIKNNSFDKELNTISDKDIEQYLEQHGQDVDAALVASSTDDDNLPSPEDYIIDDKTLDNYLSSANLTN